MTSGEKYVAAAYLVVLVFVLLYVLIIGAKLGRLSREVDEIADLARRKAEAEKAAKADASEAAPVG